MTIRFFQTLYEGLSLNNLFIFHVTVRVKRHLGRFYFQAYLKRVRYDYKALSTCTKGVRLLVDILSTIFQILLEDLAPLEGVYFRVSL